MTMRGRFLKTVPLLGCALSLLLGCGGAETPEIMGKLVPVSGTVTADGKPVSGATVTFVPVGTKGDWALGYTDQDGKYELHTAVGGASASDTVGAVPGQYKVSVSQVLMPDGSPVPEGMTEADAMAEDAKEALPPKVSDLELTELTATVAAESEEPIDLVIAN